METVSVDVRTDFWDDVLRGLVLRVSETGVKSWTVVYTRESDGSKQRLTIGKHPQMTLEAARRKAMALLAGIGEGKDPSNDRRALRAAMTVRDLGALFIDKYAKPNKRTWQEDLRILEREVYPAIGSIKASLVKRRDVLDIVQAKADAGFVAQSRQVLATARKMFGWAVDEDYLESSPAVGIKPRGKAVQRERVLSDAELRAVWNALQTAALAPATAEILRLLVLTGQRSGEVCGMTRSEIDLAAATWTIAKERVKNGRTHVVPLSSSALEILSARFAIIDDALSTPLFSRVGTAIEPNAIAQAVRKKLQLFDESWTPHDLRRTAATGMSGLGVLPHIIEATLNHVSGFRAGVAGVYNRNQFEPEKRRALDAWAAHVADLVTGSDLKARENVVELRRAK